mgnify:CR=1 FL=1
MKWLLMLWTFAADAQILYYKPGEPIRQIFDNGNGYTVTDSKNGTTEVLDLDGLMLISRPTGPTEFILYDEPLPGLNPVLPTLPLVPAPDIELSIPVGPNNEAFL